MSRGWRWRNNKALVFGCEVRREFVRGIWRVTAWGPHVVRLTLLATSKADTRACAHKMALALCAFYDKKLPPELVAIVRGDAHKGAGYSKKGSAWWELVA